MVVAPSLPRAAEGEGGEPDGGEKQSGAAERRRTYDSGSEKREGFKAVGVSACSCGGC